MNRGSDVQRSEYFLMPFLAGKDHMSLNTDPWLCHGHGVYVINSKS